MKKPEEHDVPERVLKIIQMSRIAWLNPRAKIDPPTHNRLEIHLHVGVLLKQDKKVPVYLLEAQVVFSLQMWMDKTVSDEILVDDLEEAVKAVGMGVFLLEETPPICFELVDRN